MRPTKKFSLEVETTTIISSRPYALEARTPSLQVYDTHLVYAVGTTRKYKYTRKKIPRKIILGDLRACYLKQKEMCQTARRGLAEEGDTHTRWRSLFFKCVFDVKRRCVLAEST